MRWWWKDVCWPSAPVGLEMDMGIAGILTVLRVANDDAFI